MSSLKGKIALITGATSGIGESCAKHFAAAGAFVVVAGRNQDRGMRVVNDIIHCGHRSIFKHLDVSLDSSIQDCILFVAKTFGKFDILVNCAGVNPISPVLEEIPRISLTEMFDVNVCGLIMMTSASLPYINIGGNIINIASVAGLADYTSGRMYAYSASKASVIKFTKQLAKNYASVIRVNAIAPGIIKTPIFVHFDEERYKSMVPMGRVGIPEDVAKVAVFLASDDAGYMTGTVLIVDGGQTL